ncbi:MAG: enoyl-CoA hydratase-related protein [Thermodesulfobacteriota bacterium]
MYKEILFEKKDRIAVLTLNRPDKNNTVTDENVISEIESALNSVNQDKSLSVLVLKSSGRIFSAGGDIGAMKDKKGMFAGKPDELFENYEKNVQRIPRAFYSLEVPSVAAVNGPASGAGCDLAFMCDLRVASEKAWFSQAFINVGLISGDGGLYFLQKAVKHPLMAEMVFTGARISAQRAYEACMINRVVDPDNLEESALQLAGEIASKPPKTVRLAHKLMKQAYRKDLEAVLYTSGLTQSLCHNTNDHFEAVNAFLEKRNPVFKGE